MIRRLLSSVTGIGAGALRVISGGPWLTYIIVALIGALAIYAAVQRAQLANCKTQHAEYVAEIERAQSAAAASTAQQTATAVEETGRIDTTHDQELDHAQAAADALRSDLAAARQQLRQRFTCAARSASLPGAASAARPADEAAGLRPDDAGFLVGTADRADADIRALQALVLSYRKACNG